MSWKFLSIGKANAEIDRLNTEVAAIAKERDELKASIESNNSEVSKQAEAIQAQLVEANKAVEAHTAKIVSLEAAVAAKEVELKAATEKAAAVEIKIAQAAAHKAAEITAAQGQPPVVVPVATGPNSKQENNLTGLARTIAAMKAEKSENK